MSITTVRVSQKGQIAIPQEIREHLKIKKGTDLILIQLENRIILEKTQDREERIRKEVKHILKSEDRHPRDTKPRHYIG